MNPSPPSQPTDAAIDEDAIYAAIANELESGAADKGLPLGFLPADDEYEASVEGDEFVLRNQGA